MNNLLKDVKCIFVNMWSIRPRLYGITDSKLHPTFSWMAQYQQCSLWVAMLRAWNRKDVERFSPVQSAILEPISCMNLRPIGAHDPKVSTATGITVKPLAANAS